MLNQTTLHMQAQANSIPLTFMAIKCIDALANAQSQTVERCDRQSQNTSYKTERWKKTFAYYLQGKWLVHNQLNKINRLALCLWIVLAHISVVWFQVAWALVLYVSWGITPDRYNNDISRTECEPFNF